jgi:hypothetical protein
LISPTLKRWKLILAAAVAIIALAALAHRLLYPPAPDLTNAGYTSASFDFREYDESTPALKASTSDPAVLQAFARVLAMGKSDVNCRCIDLATVTLTRPNGTQFTLKIMPAHSAQDCQFSVGDERYTVDRPKLLAAVAPLGIPPIRWSGP